MTPLLDWRRSARDACVEFLGWERARNDEVVRLATAVHTTCFAPSGAGKGTSLIVPFLRSCPDSCFVIDFKGENALLTAAHRRRRFGHRIIMLDPYHVVTKTPDSFNPLDFIDEKSPFALDHCNDLADALVVRDPQDSFPHFSDSAVAWIGGIAAATVAYAERNDSRSLQTIAEIFAKPQVLETAVKLMCGSDMWNGMLARRGGQLLHYIGRERASTLTTIARHLRFLNTPAIEASTRTSTFHPGALREGGMTIYCVLPPDHMRAQSPLLRLWVDSMLRAVVQGGLGEERLVHFILDEAASLGHLESIDDAVDKFRGYGVRLQFYFQSQAQLQRCFPEGQDVTLLSNSAQVYFGCNTLSEAEQISGRLGEQTIVVSSGGRSWGTSTQTSQSFGHGQQTSSGRSETSSDNWQQQARKLLKPEEVLQLPRRMAITFVPGIRPILTWLTPYYEEGASSQGGFFRGGLLVVRVFVMATYWFVGAAGFAYALHCCLLEYGFGGFFRMLAE